MHAQRDRDFFVERFVLPGFFVTGFALGCLAFDGFVLLAFALTGFAFATLRADTRGFFVRFSWRDFDFRARELTRDARFFADRNGADSGLSIPPSGSSSSSKLCSS
jgi:hypothetical protein